MRQWRNNASLKDLEIHAGLKKPTHCRKCSLNSQNGTHKCKGRRVICACPWHVKKVEADSHRVELDVRRKALKDPNFPDEKIIDAFLRPESQEVYDLEWREPKWAELLEFCSCLGDDWRQESGRKKLLPLVTSWTTNFCDEKSSPLAKPIKIVKTRLQNRHPMYEIWWETQESFPQMLLPSGDRGFLSHENQAVFRNRFPDIVAAFEKEQAQSRKSTPIKRRKNETSQPLMTSLLPVRKQMRFTPCNSPKRPLRPSDSPLPHLIDLDDDVQFNSFIEAKN
ncbi:hypothetical protein CAPTEDRAFT_226364 [Capitella teleta]|uniref:Flap endonuclease GEN chromatin organization modifier domain-containing protein n=1 Tax=Capitella teleta TaxID=283909 RepID=R7TQH5_CAPTE|nr:hypothetical protein CAPTEDRAFT_226364 [Capitella teleta]|eukprot:ELT93280.1 hypothetical protein CAPTEDRAFT_226364 [Capitella teleta]